jgi:outer membrane protein assembly factor BamB
MNFIKLAAVVLAGMALAACSDKSKAVDPPAKLVDIKPVLRVNKLWSDSLAGDKHLRLGLQPSIDQGVVYAASRKGEVVALTADKGKHLWQINTKLELSAGPAAADGLVVVANGVGCISCPVKCCPKRSLHKALLWRARWMAACRG